MKNVLVLQVRNDKLISEHDYSCYERIVGSKVNLNCLNLYNEKESVHTLLEKYDGYILGGSHLPPDHFFENEKILESLIDECIDRGKPFLGICYGFQRLSRRLGAEFVEDIPNQEFCTKQMELTGFGKTTKLFEGIPEKFNVSLGHNYRLSVAPKNTEDLVLGESPNLLQGIKVKNKSIYGVLFHPEMNKADIRYRLRDYNDRNLGHGYKFSEEILLGYQDSDEADKMLRNFVEKVV